MANKLVMGYWDCPYCDQKKIKGILRECPTCGHPRDEGTKFYMSDMGVDYLSEEESKTKGKGADWICPYCNALNSALLSECKGCGAPKDDASKDYFGKNLHEEEPAPEKPKPVQKNTIAPWKRLLFPFLALLAVIAIIIAVVPKNKNASVDEKHWQLTVPIEEEKTVEESDWYLPDGGRLITTKEEVHHTDQVVDHYETKERTYTEQVLDHYETEVYYTDNGDGSFTEHTSERPVYRTEERVEYVEEPVYRPVPVYKTKYYYEIERWFPEREVVTSGTSKEEPYEGEVILSENERRGDSYGEYTVDVSMKKKQKTYKVSREIYDALKTGRRYKLSVKGNEILGIKK